MAVSGFQESFPKTKDMTLWRFAIIILVLALVYLVAGLMTAPEIGMMTSGLAFPLKLFLVASAPMLGGIAFLWSDRAITNPRRRRLTQLLFILLWAFGVVTLVGFFSW